MAYDLPCGPAGVLTARICWPGQQLLALASRPTSQLHLYRRRFFFSLVIPRPTKDLRILIAGVAQTQNQSFDFNGESDLDLEYAMGLTNPLNITLLQTGDLVEGAGFDNWLDAVDASFCTFDGGDVPGQDGIYPDDEPGGFNRASYLSYQSGSRC